MHRKNGILVYTEGIVMKILIDLDEINSKMFRKALDYYNLNNKVIDEERFAEMNLLDSIHDYIESNGLEK